MAMQYNFQPLTFADYNGMEREANRRYYDSLGSIGGTIAKTGEKVDSYLQRKQKEEEDKKKWDNMIAEQEYRKEQDRINREYQYTRDAIADARYNNEWNEKQKKLQLEENKYYRDRNSLENLKAGVRQAYTPEALKKYGPSAQARLAAIMNSNDIATAQQQVGELNRDMYQQDMMDFQREQANLDRVPNKSVTQINDSLSREGIDLRTIPKKVNDKKQRVVDVDKVQRQIDVIEEQIRKLEALEPNDNVSAKRTELLLFKSKLQDALIPGYKEPTPTLADLLVSR